MTPPAPQGGGLNLPPSMGLDQPTAGGFTRSDGANGARGGGDLLVVAPTHKAWKGRLSAAGGVNYQHPGSNGHPGKTEAFGAKPHVAPSPRVGGRSARILREES